MMDIIANPLIIAYLALAVSVLTAIRVFVPGEDNSSTAKSAPAPAAAPVAASPAPVVSAPGEDEEAVVAAITAALSLYVGGGFTIRSIRPAAGGGNAWVTAGRLENVTSM